MKNVLITSGEPRIAYVMANAIYANGYNVYIGDTSKFSMAAVSRRITGKMVYASPTKNEEQFIADVEAFIKEKDIHVLMPSLDEAFILAKHKERLETIVNLVVPSYDKIQLAHDKYIITDTAKELGIPVPETWEAVAILNSPDSMTSLPYPVIIKPKKGKGGWGTEKLSTPEELQKALQETVNLHEYIIQRFIDGKVIATCAIYNAGQCVACDTYIATAVYPLKVGQPTRRKREHFEDALQSLTKLLDHLQWHGLCEVDFIVDEHNGKSYLLDFNPRCWSSVTQNITSGINYPLYYCEIALGKKDIYIPRPRNVRTCFLSADLQRTAKELLQAKSKWNYIKHRFTCRETLDAYDDWNIKDPIPFVCWWIKAIHRKLFTR